MIRTSPSRKGSQTKLDERSERRDIEGDSGSVDVDVEGDMILGDLDPDANEDDPSGPSVSTNTHSKGKHLSSSIRNDVDDIVTGDSFLLVVLLFICSSCSDKIP